MWKKTSVVLCLSAVLLGGSSFSFAEDTGAEESLWSYKGHAALIEAAQAAKAKKHRLLIGLSGGAKC